MKEETEIKYYIDPTVLAIFFKLDLQEDIDEVYANYMDGVTMIMQGAIDDFIQESALPDDKANELRSLYKEINDPERSTIDEDKINKFRDYVIDPSLQKRIEEAINIYNKTIYDKQSQTLSQQEKNSLNEYIAKKEKLNNTDIDTLVTVNKIYDYLIQREKEINKRKQPNPVDTQTTTPIPETPKPIEQTRPANTVNYVQGQLAELANQVRTQSPYPSINLSQVGVSNSPSPANVVQPPQNPTPATIPNTMEPKQSL